jgi:hypothetical protein
MASVADDGSPAIRDRPDLKRKRSMSPSSGPPTVAGGGSNSPLDQIQSKRSRPHRANNVATITARSPSIESKNRTIIESAVSQLRLDAQNRLDKLKEQLGAWERDGVVS